MNIHTLGKLGKKQFTSLIASAAIIIILVITCTIIVRYSLNVNIKGQQALDNIEEYANHLSRSLIDQETGQRGYILTRDEIFLEPYYSGVKEYSDSSKTLIEITEGFPVLNDKLNSVLQKGDYWQDHYGESIVSMIQNGEQPSVQLLLDGKNAIDDFRKDTIHFSQDIEAERSQVRNLMRKRINTTLISLVVAISVIILTNLYITFRLLQSVIKPIIQLSNCVKSYTEHDFTKEIPTYRKKDELNDLITNIDLMRTELSKNIRSLKSKVHYDELTGLYNRRYFNEFILDQWKHAAKISENISLILFDIDYYKNFNDLYGHLAGDECLQIISQCLIQSPELEEIDFAARYGGEEFAVLLLNKTEQEASSIAEKIRMAIVNLKIPHKASPINNYVTVSLGVAAIIPTSGMKPNDLIMMADNALYKSKQNGRNRFSLSGS